MTIELGDVAKDTITGFQGVVICDYKFLNGCRRLALQPTACDKDGKPIQDASFDIEQLVLVKKAKPRTVDPSGGSRPMPAQRSIPSR